MATAESVVIHQARWVIPVAGPVLADGAVAVAGGRILAVGPAADIRERHRTGSWGTGEVRSYHHGEGAILPALVNTHLHLEYTALRGAIAPQTNLPAWLQAAIEGYRELTPAAIDQGVREGIAEMRRYGTVLAAEVSNSGRSLPILADAGGDYHYFYECLGFNLLTDRPLPEDFPFLAQPPVASLPVSAAAHAPYSVAAPLFRRIKAWNRAQGRPGGVHLAESPEEIHFLQYGDGAFQKLLARRGRWYEGYTPPGCSPAVYLDRLGFWDGPTLAVHGVWLEDRDRELLACRGVYLALCPRSNVHTGVGFPDLTALQRAGVNLTLGTDSLASSQDFNLFKDIKMLADRFPGVRLSDLLTMATRHGAAALDRPDLGSLETGKKAAMLFLPIPAGAPLWPGVLEAGVQGRIYWLTASGKEIAGGA